MTGLDLVESNVFQVFDNEGELRLYYSEFHPEIVTQQIEAHLEQSEDPDGELWKESIYRVALSPQNIIKLG